MNTKAFNEKVKLNVANNFDQSVRIYQEFEEKHCLFHDLTLKMAEAIDIKVRSTVLDVGCGYGVSTKALQDRFDCTVMGVDLSPKMIEAGRSLYGEADIKLCVGDGENLSPVVGDQRFDYVLYNASIFIFPDVSKTIAESCQCLRSGGKIAFSFYPQLIGNDNEDLLDLAFQRLGEPVPRFRVITDYPKACEALSSRCKNLVHHRWMHPLDIELLQDFFSIPAQSASLFPGRGYEERCNLVKRLFETFGEIEKTGNTIWRLAEGTK